MPAYSSLKGRALLFLGFLWFIWFMNFSVRTIFSPIPPLIEDDFIITHARATSVFFYSSVGYSISLFLSGLFSGYVGHRRSISVSLFIWAVLLIPTAGARHIGWVLFLQATTVMGYFPVGLVAISRAFPVEQRSLATGIVTTLGVMFGLGFIPYLLGPCGDVFGFSAGIRILGACVALSSVLTLFMRIDQGPSKHSPNH